ncbi:MAG TPA: MFS transporter, partial [Methylomirabilota bacterium]|nr:MFS transporter [Methylomirabilota bacterium]
METVKRFGHRTFSSLKIRNYRLYFIGQGISLSGTWMQTVALGLLVLQLTHSGTILGIVLALQFLPILLFGPIAGVMIDRYSKRKMLYLTQSAAAILALLMGLFLFFGVIQIGMVYVFAICLGIITAIDSPTRQAFLMELVGKDGIKNAIALNSSEVNLARILGPALGGIVIAAVGL